MRPFLRMLCFTTELQHLYQKSFQVLDGTVYHFCCGLKIALGLQVKLLLNSNLRNPSSILLQYILTILVSKKSPPELCSFNGERVG